MQEYNGIKVGSLVLGMAPGYWKVVEIVDRRPTYPDPLVAVQLVMDEDGTEPLDAVFDRYDIGHCVLVDEKTVETIYRQAFIVAERVRRNLIKALKAVK